MSSSSPNSSPPQIATLCRLAHLHRRYHQLATHAQTYITQYPSSPAAWTYLAFALHTLRRHAHAAVNFSIALTLARTRAPKNIPSLRLLLRISHFLISLHDSAKIPSPTVQLQAGWYRTELETRLAAGDVVFLRPYATFRPPDPPPKVSLHTCTIIQDPDPTCFEETTFPRLGGERRLNPSSIPAFPIAQTAGGYLFLKERILSLGCECYDDGNAPCRDCRDFPLPLALFPKLLLHVPSTVRVLGGPLCNVQVATDLVHPEIHALLEDKLGRLAASRNDAPVKNYHNIIDPNIAAVNGLWVPTDVFVEMVPTSKALHPLNTAFENYTGKQLPEDVLHHIHTVAGAPSYATAKLRSAIPDLNPQKHGALHLAVEHVLSAALPLLANLQLPALLLPGPLQVVVKAQRIVLAEGERYAGLWHEDGLREHVVAIVLYYYGISPSLTGGDMEFGSKIRIPMSVGDGVGPYRYNKDGVREAALDQTVKAPVREGTMLVFSNYALVHRVLPILAEGGAGSRDFLAFFIIDQQHPLPMPDRLGPRKERIRKRAQMLCEQLEVRGHFGLDSSEVTTTGNGQYTDLVWIRSGKSFPMETTYGLVREDEEDEVIPIVSRLNMFPPVIGRGSSFLTELDLPNVEFNAASSFVLHAIEGRQRRQIFVDTRDCSYTSVREIPIDGIREVRMFDSMAEWLDQGLRYWTSDENLAAGMRLHQS